MAVGPAQPGAQVDREDATVGADVPALGEIRQRRAHIGADRHGRFPIEELPAVVQGDAGGAAVLADAAQRLDHHRIVRQAFAYRRQVAIVE